MTERKRIARAATDVGGTFAGLVLFTLDPETGPSTIRTAKTATTPPDCGRGMLRALQKAEVDLATAGFLAHGTAVVINALAERKGVTVGLVATEGFRDTLEIARGNRPDFFNLHCRKPPPFVPRRLRRELPGRMDYRGTEMRPLDLAPLAGILEDFQAEGVEAVAICFPHSCASPAHEQASRPRKRKSAACGRRRPRSRRTASPGNGASTSAPAPRRCRPMSSRRRRGISDASKPRLPGRDSLAAPASCSRTAASTLPPRRRGSCRHDRVRPLLRRLRRGGARPADRRPRRDRPRHRRHDGKMLADRKRQRQDRHRLLDRARRQAGHPVTVPVVDLAETGGGGGSVAWADEFGKLRVGPRSAGAVPGPAAYGMGGAAATTAGANLWLGRIDRDKWPTGSGSFGPSSTGKARRAAGQGGGCRRASRWRRQP